jgi:hypothetical protein
MLVGRESELTRLAALLEEEAGAAAGRKLRESGALATLRWLSFFPIRRAGSRLQAAAMAAQR